MLGGLVGESSVERPHALMTLVGLPSKGGCGGEGQGQNLTQSVHLVGLWGVEEEPEEGLTGR